MLGKEMRKNPYPSQELICHLKGTRGKKYFPHCENLKERYSECFNAILNQNIGVIVPDKRTNSLSNHVCLFINGAKENIALPLGIDDEGKISIITIKNIAENEENPSWFYEQYNSIAKTRKMQLMEKIWRMK